MSKCTEYRPRLNVDITPEQDALLRRYLEHGVKGPLFRCLIDDLLEMLVQNPELIIGLVLSRKLRLQGIIKGWKEEPSGHI